MEQDNKTANATAEYIFPNAKRKPFNNLAVALCIAILTIICEYGFRHYVMFWFPVISSLRVNDMISLFFAYTLIVGGFVLIKQLDWRKVLKEILQALKYLVISRNGAVWLLIMVFSFEGFGFIDRIFLAKYTLPMYLSTFQNSIVWLVGLAPFLNAISLLLINGLLVPIAEEFLWRGLVQVYLTRLLSPILSIGITAVLFSFKHVLVDASFGRFLSIIAFGVVCGILAYRKGWETSAALHMLINTLFTIAGLIVD